nr:hypothetical protein BaRGS_027902 [Batillaria attramentaria]
MKGRLVGVVRAVSSRALFAGHAVTMLLDTNKRLETSWTKYLYIALVGQIAEAAFTCFYGKEVKGVCPVVINYLIVVVPSFWLRTIFVEERVLANMRVYVKNQNCSPPFSVEGNHFYLYGYEYVIPRVLDGETELNAELVMQYVMLTLLIVGRWLLPRGKMSKQQLSRLLLIQIGIAGDIADFFGSLSSSMVQCEFGLVILVLALWTVSLVQFIFVYPESSLYTSYTNIIDRFKDRHKDIERSVFLNPEVSSTLISLCMQDIPYLAVRIFFSVTADEQRIDEDSAFFIFKNTLVIILGGYRIYFLNK